ncbi:response regulator [Acidobacteria bacterium ACD]|nr:MAG: response regulator [Acidobacteriota bacterium]MCE7958528.1 response regulator [Acidobacteria bacterium ACB2]MDL1950727.1 response regulator [Acidobacteria bacterium ACD]
MLEGRRVLVVEDNEQNMELVEFLLEEAGASVEKAVDADSLRSRLPAPPPDLVLMDMNLPGADGLSLVAEVRDRAAWAAVPVVALTALAMRGDRERILAAGCQGYVAKPIDVATFVSDVARFVGPRGEGA